MAADEGAFYTDWKNFNAHSFFIGDYDWSFLCMPRWPWGEPKPPPPFFAKNEQVSVVVTLIMGFQHCLAMVGGIVTVPLIISGPYTANMSPQEQQYLISASLIVSGLASIVQIMQPRVPFTRLYIGSGLLSVMGISFTFLPVAQSSIPKMTQCACNGTPCRVWEAACQPCVSNGNEGLAGSCMTGQQAYGALLGTVMCCAWLNVAFSFVPVRILKRLFPPVVTGTTVTLIGISLCKTGVAYWGGGVYCSDQVLTSQALCDNNGQVTLPFGSPEYVGLGFVVFFTLIITELFGSPFLRNVSVAVGLAVGMIVASCLSYYNCVPNPPSCTQQCFNVLPYGVSYNPATNGLNGTAPPNAPTFVNSTVCQEACTPVGGDTCESWRYVTGDRIANADWITFLWVYTFPIGIYGPAVLPMLFGFLVSCMECIGDTTATTEASGLVPAGDEYTTAVSGAIRADGLNSFLAACATMMPVVTFSANNGIISLTRCAARRTGLGCAAFLILFGVIAKFAAIILTIPDCILGGMTSFLFINVMLSGMRVLTMDGGLNRRNRFIAAMALTLGIGIILLPPWLNIAGQPQIFPYEGHFWPINPDWSPGMSGFRDAIIIVLTTGYSIGGLTALILNLIMPYEAEDDDEMGVIDPEKEEKLQALKEDYPHPSLPHDDPALDPYRSISRRTSKGRVSSKKDGEESAPVLEAPAVVAV